MGVKNMLFELIYLSLLFQLGYSLVSPPAAQEITVETPIDPEFIDTQEALKRHKETEFKSKKQKKPPPPKKRKSALKNIHFSVWDITEDQDEIDCREYCANRYMPIQEEAEKEICETQTEDDLAPESCGTGVDAGLLSGCKAWCNPKIPTKKVFRFDKIFKMIEKFPKHSDDRLDVCTLVQGGTRIVIQRVDKMLKRQPIQTKACEYGFNAAFISVITSEQRLLGIDKLTLPVVFWEHPIMGNDRRHRYSYWWGGTDKHIEAKKECGIMYPDQKMRYDFCMEKIIERWTKEIDEYIFVVTDPTLKIGENSLSNANKLTMLTQEIQTLSLEGNITTHMATRYLGETNEEAAFSFCDSVHNLRIEPYLTECLITMKPLLKYEEEVELDELVKLRLY
mmetsp:Transcript_13414/g.17365  ORF Transcript_13414/g.17365 Transcript_13414/m.17365 type:complete len:394 (+) Transcript_13414:14-1195(+)